jgi:hypothetical protein
LPPHSRDFAGVRFGFSTDRVRRTRSSGICCFIVIRAMGFFSGVLRFIGGILFVHRILGFIWAFGFIETVLGFLFRPPANCVRKKRSENSPAGAGNGNIADG